MELIVFVVNFNSNSTFLNKQFQLIPCLLKTLQGERGSLTGVRVNSVNQSILRRNLCCHFVQNLNCILADSSMKCILQHPEWLRY